MDTSSKISNESDFPIVGRDSRIDLSKYIVKVLGRDVIDYERIRKEDPTLYADIVNNELKSMKNRSEELDEILAMPSTPVESVTSFTAINKPATAKYFYLPVFVSNLHLDPHDEIYEVNLLTYSDNSEKPMSYASRVLPGRTLVEAIKDDLREDFKYDGQFRIVNHYFYDTAPDKHGTPLPRYAVLIEVDRFPTDTILPAKLHAYWSDDGKTILQGYQFQIS